MPDTTGPACDCRQIILDLYAARGVDVNVSHLPPLVDSGYEPLNMHCPHGVHWYAEPTSEQRARYAVRCD